MKYLRRLIWYVSTRLMVLVAVLGLAVLCFYFFMNATNIYVILKDGMAKRAQTVMMGADQEELKKVCHLYLPGLTDFDGFWRLAQEISPEQREEEP